MKYIAKQIAPEYQESPFNWCDNTYYMRMVFIENRDFRGLIGGGAEAFEEVKKVLEDGALADALNDIKTGWYEANEYEPPYKSVREAVEDYLRKDNGEPFTDAEIEKIRIVCEWFGTAWKNVCVKSDEEYICDIMDIIAGGAWKTRTLRGSYQSDWIEIVYDADAWTDEDVAIIENEFFNEGSEWMVYEDGADDYEITVYAHKWSDDGIKKEIAAEIGYETSPEDIELWAFDGWTRTEKYRIA